MMVYILGKGIIICTSTELKDYGIPSVVVTFDPHPREILNQNLNDFPLIMNLEQKLKIIEACGVDIVCVINFEDYSKLKK